MFPNLSQDLRATVDSGRRAGLKYWLYLLGRAVLAPQFHAVVLFRIGAALARTPLAPMALVCKAMGIVWSGADIHPKAQIGPGFMVAHSSGVTIGADVRAGRNLRVNCGANIGGMRLREPLDPSRPTFLGDDVFVGANVMILQDCHIGDGAVIGANSVVSKDVPPGAVVSGIPAKVIRSREP